MKRSVLDDQDYFDSLKFVAVKNRKDLQRRVIRTLPLAAPTSRLNRCALPAPDGTKRDDAYLLSVHYRHHAATPHDSTAPARNFTPLTLLRGVVDVLQSFEAVRWDHTSKLQHHHNSGQDQNGGEDDDDDETSSSFTSSSSSLNNPATAHAKQVARGIEQCKADFADTSDVTAEDLALLGTLASGDTEFLANVHGYGSLHGGRVGGGGVEAALESGISTGLELPRPDTALLTKGRVTSIASSQHISHSIQHHDEENRLNSASVLRVGNNDTAIDVFTRLVQTECASVLVLLELFGALSEFDRRIRGAILARRGALNKLKQRPSIPPGGGGRVSMSDLMIGLSLKGGGNSKNATAEAAMIGNALRGSAGDDGVVSSGEEEEEDGGPVTTMPPYAFGSGAGRSSSLGGSASLNASSGSEGGLGDSLNLSENDDSERARSRRARDHRRELRRQVRESKARSKVRKAQRKKVVAHLQKLEDAANAVLESARREVRERAGSVIDRDTTAASPTTTAAEGGGGRRSIFMEQEEAHKMIGSLRRKSSTIAERRAKMYESSQKEKKRQSEYNTLRRKRSELQIHAEYLDVVDELVDTLQQAYLDITASASNNGNTADGATSEQHQHIINNNINSSNNPTTGSLLKANCPLLMVRLFDLQLSAADGTPSRCYPSLLPPVTPFYFPKYKLEELQQLMRMQDDDDSLLVPSEVALSSPRGGKFSPPNHSKSSKTSPFQNHQPVTAYIPPRHTITHAEAYCREYVEESIHEIQIDTKRITHQRNAMDIIGIASADQMVETFTNKREQLLWDVRIREEDLDKQRRRLGLRAQMGKMGAADAQFEITAITEEIERMYKVVPVGLSDEELQLMYTAPASPFQHAAAARIRSSALAAQLRTGAVDGMDAATGSSSAPHVDATSDDSRPFSRGLLIPPAVPQHVLSFSEEDGKDSDAACVAESIKAYYLTPLHLRRLQVSSVSLFSPSEVLLSYAHQLKMDLLQSTEAKANKKAKQQSAAMFGPYSQLGGGSVAAPSAADGGESAQNSNNRGNAATYKYPMAVTVTLQETLRTFLSTTLIPELLLRLEGDFKHYCASYKVLSAASASAGTTLSIHTKNLERRLDGFRRMAADGNMGEGKSPVQGGGSKSPIRSTVEDKQGVTSPSADPSPNKDGTGSGPQGLGNTFAAIDQEMDDAIAAVAIEMNRAREKKLECAELEGRRRERERAIAERRQREESEARERALTRETERQRIKAAEEERRRMQEQRRQDGRVAEVEAAKARREALARPLAEARQNLESRLTDEIKIQAPSSMAAVYPSLDVVLWKEGVVGNRRVARRTEAKYSGEAEVEVDGETVANVKAKLVEEIESQDERGRVNDFSIPRNNLARSLNATALEAKFLGPLVTPSGKPIDPRTIEEAYTRPSDELVGIVANIDERMSHERLYSDKTMQRKRQEVEDRMADKFHDGVLQQFESSKYGRRSDSRRINKELSSQRAERQGILDLYTKHGDKRTEEGLPRTRGVRSAPSPGRGTVGWGSHTDAPRTQSILLREKSQHELETSHLKQRLLGHTTNSALDDEVEVPPPEASKSNMKHTHGSASVNDRMLKLALSSLGYDADEREMALQQREINVASNPHNPLRTDATSASETAEIETRKRLANKPASIVDVFASTRDNNDQQTVGTTTEMYGAITGHRRAHRAKQVEVTAPHICAPSQPVKKRPSSSQPDNAPPINPTIFERLSILRAEEGTSDDDDGQPKAPVSVKDAGDTEDVAESNHPPAPQRIPPQQVPQQSAVFVGRSTAGRSVTLQQARERTSVAQREVQHIGFVPSDTPVQQ